MFYFYLIEESCFLFSFSFLSLWVNTELKTSVVDLISLVLATKLNGSNSFLMVFSGSRGAVEFDLRSSKSFVVDETPPSSSNINKGFGEDSVELMSNKDELTGDTSGFFGSSGCSVVLGLDVVLLASPFSTANDPPGVVEAGPVAVDEHEVLVDTVVLKEVDFFEPDTA